MDRLIDTVEQYLQYEREWSFKRIPDRTAVRSEIRGKNSMYTVHFRTDEEDEILQIYTMLPHRAPEEQRLKVAEYVTRANYGLRIGSFEFDIRDGKVRYKVSVDVEGGALTYTMIDNMVGAGLSTMDRYFEGFMMVYYAGRSAEEAIDKIESGKKENSDPFLRSTVDESSSTMSTRAFAPPISGNSISMEAAAHTQEELLFNAEATNDVNNKVNLAARLMTSQQYELCIQAYERIVQAHPEEQSTCESQIGVAYFFLGDYEKAIQFYKQALEHGADPGMMADNIAEAEEALAKKNEDN